MSTVLSRIIIVLVAIACTWWAMEDRVKFAGLVEYMELPFSVPGIVLRDAVPWAR